MLMSLPSKSSAFMGVYFDDTLVCPSHPVAWSMLAIPAVLMRKNDSAIIWAVLAAIHGLCFGALCSIPYFFIGGWTMALSYWVSGIPFDIAHCIGNFVTVLVLYRPLKKVMSYALRDKNTNKEKTPM